MRTSFTTLHSNVAKALGAIGMEPLVQLDLSKLELRDLSAFIIALISGGTDTARAIYAYLSTHGFQFDYSSLCFVLDQHDGGDRRTCHWRRQKDGSYALLEHYAS